MNPASAFQTSLAPAIIGRVVITSTAPNTKMKLKKKSDKQSRSVTHYKDFFFFTVLVAEPAVD